MALLRTTEGSNGLNYRFALHYYNSNIGNPFGTLHHRSFFRTIEGTGTGTEVHSCIANGSVTCLGLPSRSSWRFFLFGVRLIRQTAITVHKVRVFNKASLHTFSKILI